MSNLLNEFDALASVSRVRVNSVSNKLLDFLRSEKESKAEITKITAEMLDCEKIHIQALYSALKKLGIEVSRGKSFVVKSVDTHYFNEAIVKL